MLKKKYIIIFIIISLIVSCSIILVNYYYNDIEEEVLIEEYIGDTTSISTDRKTTGLTSKLKNRIKKIVKSTTKTTSNNYLFILDIPKINIKKGIYNKNSSLNNVDKNITILPSSSMPDEKNGSVILASHNGNTRVSYFKNLEKLSKDDLVYIYYKGNKYTYKIYKNEIVDKVGKINVNKKSNVSTICLISCKNGTNDKQIVYLGELINTTTY